MKTRYSPEEIETKWYKFWEERGYFHADEDSDKPSYTIVIPPPNVTGVLHMGHALNNTIQDILIRWKRMKGYNALWIPGTDHAGIATQNVVEKKLASQGLSRNNLGREKFLEEVWAWKEKYGNTIIHQLKRLGCSCDWRRTRFTLDEGLNKAVMRVFVHLYKKGLIYKGNKIINWCPRCMTALSDEEVQHKEHKDFLYYIKYPLKDPDSSDTSYLEIATTRPETMLGDTAVAMHPKDKRYKKLKGKIAILPLANREIPIIEDEFVDPKFGTGLVKVTPFHDPNDYEIATRHNLPGVLAITTDGKMADTVGARYAGLDRFQARKLVIEDLQNSGLLVRIEPHTHNVGHCYRCDTIIEPYLSEQWFVRMKPLAQPAIEVAEQGKIKFYPRRWTKVYLNWLYNIKDWCISRQLWWGHRIPVWYCDDCKELTVSEEPPSRCQSCSSTNIHQDEDVLDTWFSSWLWPFSTMGWPAKTKTLEVFYPTDTLVTAPEILFFWVARMIIAGLEFMGKIPFKEVYLHGTVRDEFHRKMSKSLNNIIDPLDIINQYGADALRITLLLITAQGQDILLSTQKFEIGRNFASKIWNAARLIITNLDGFEKIDWKYNQLKAEQRWIISRATHLIREVEKAIAAYRFNEAAQALYRFFWHEFCDWYLEMAKIDLYQKDNPQRRKLTQNIAVYVLDLSLRLLHPFMPFLTEEIWQNLPIKEEALIIAKMPEYHRHFVDLKIEQEFEIFMEIVKTIRNIRSEMGIAPQQAVPAIIYIKDEKVLQFLKEQSELLGALAKLSSLKLEKEGEKPAYSAAGVVKNGEVFIPLKGLVDIEKEMARLQKELQKANEDIEFFEKKLNNPDFLKKAPEEIVSKDREKLNFFLEKRSKLVEALERMKKVK